MAKPPVRVYKAVLDEHRRRLDRIADRRGAGALRKLYTEAQAHLESRLRRFGPGSQKFEAHQARVILAQVRQGQALLVNRMNGELGDISQDAQVESLRGLVTDLNKLEHHFTGADLALPIDEAARFRGVIDGRRQSLLRSHAQSLANYSARVVTKVEDALSTSLVVGDDLGQTVGRVMDVTEGEWWQAERVARTEVAWAFNATQADGMKAVAEELDDLYMRWVEHVDDDTGTPYDERVDDDSIAMHGQIARPGGLFYFPDDMPGGGAVPEELSRFEGESWAFPPMRPNDRATLSPWRPHWGIPGWRWEGGGRVAA